MDPECDKLSRQLIMLTTMATFMCGITVSIEMRLATYNDDLVSILSVLCTGGFFLLGFFSMALNLIILDDPQQYGQIKSFSNIIRSFMTMCSILFLILVVALFWAQEYSTHLPIYVFTPLIGIILLSIRKLKI